MTHYNVQLITYWNDGRTLPQWSKTFDGPTARQEVLQAVIDRTRGEYTWEISRGRHTIRIGGVNEVTEHYLKRVEQAFLELDLPDAEENWTDVPLSVSQRQVILLIKQLDGHDPVLQQLLQVVTGK